jgi:uncharacterized protein (TIGR00725 family)
MSDKHEHFKIKLSVSGAAESQHCGEGAQEKALEIGRQIVKAGAILVTGATTGLPLWTARGAKEAGGMVVGLSPAASEHEHVELYKLPLDYMDLIVYTGFGYSGRDILMTRSSDAIFILCGRVGTIHEFTVAFEDNKPIGILEQNGPTADVIKHILEKANRPNEKIIFDSDPKALVERTLELVKKDKMGHQYGVYTNGDGFYDQCQGPDCKIKL